VGGGWEEVVGGGREGRGIFKGDGKEGGGAGARGSEGSEERDRQNVRRGCG